MLQRSASGVISLAQATKMIKALYRDGYPTEISDFRAEGIPLGLTRRTMQRTLPMLKELDKELLSGLEKAGFEISDGPDGSGVLLMIFDRGGGMLFDHDTRSTC